MEKLALSSATHLLRAAGVRYDGEQADEEFVCWEKILGLDIAKADLLYRHGMEGCRWGRCMNEVTLRSKVFDIEKIMRTMPQLDLPVKHHFSQGVYGRELFIPKGCVLTGKIHKYQQLNVLCSGELSVLTEEGVKRVTPPFIIVSPPGTKRIAYAHEDSVWLTVHGTDEQDVDVIERHFIAQDETEYLEFCKMLEAKEAA